MQVGSLVECIHDFEKEPYYWSNYNINYPVKNSIYTIREVVIRRDKRNDISHGLLLEEIVNAPQLYTDGMVENAFHVDAFREIQPPMDIDIQQLLPQKQPHETERV